MRGHGAVVVATSLAQVVARSIYMEMNARIQLDALRLGGQIRYLTAEEAQLTAKNQADYPRAWDMWKRAMSPRTRRSR